MLSGVQLFCDPMNCNPPGSSVHQIPQARILEWVAISFSRGASQPRDQAWDSCIGRQILYHWAIREGNNRTAIKNNLLKTKGIYHLIVLQARSPRSTWQYSFWWEFSSWLVDGCLFTVSPYSGKGAGEEKERKRAREWEREGGRERGGGRGHVQALCVSSHKGTHPILRIPSSWPHLNLITAKGFSLLNSIIFGVQGFSKF